MSGPCLSSSVAGRPLRPATRHSLGGLLPRQLADRPRAHPGVIACAIFSVSETPPIATCGINLAFAKLSRASGQIAHVLRTLAPLNTHCIATISIPFDLHVLSTPPAFVLSQNQTLRKESCSKHDSGKIDRIACSEEIFDDFAQGLLPMQDHASWLTRSAQISLFFNFSSNRLSVNPMRQTQSNC